MRYPVFLICSGRPQLFSRRDQRRPLSGRVRNGLVLDALFGTVEIAHDYLRVSTPAGTYDQHNLRAMFSLDLIQLAWVMIEAIGSD